MSRPNTRALEMAYRFRSADLSTFSSVIRDLKAILKSSSDNDVMSGTFKEVFKYAFVRFLHFAKNVKDNPTTTHTAWASIVRGMAVQCSRNQHMIDAMVPLVLWDEKLCEEIMSGVLIQVKNKEDTEILVIDEAQIGKGARFFPKDKPEDRRHCAMKSSFRQQLVRVFYINIGLGLGLTSQLLARICSIWSILDHQVQVESLPNSVRSFVLQCCVYSQPNHPSTLAMGVFDEAEHLWSLARQKRAY